MFGLRFIFELVFRKCNAAKKWVKLFISLFKGSSFTLKHINSMKKLDLIDERSEFTLLNTDLFIPTIKK